MPTIVLIGSSGILSKAIQTKLRKNKLPFSLINICRENHLSNKDKVLKKLIETYQIKIVYIKY